MRCRCYAFQTLFCDFDNLFPFGCAHGFGGVYNVGGAFAVVGVCVFHLDVVRTLLTAWLVGCHA